MQKQVKNIIWKLRTYKTVKCVTLLVADLWKELGGLWRNQAILMRKSQSFKRWSHPHTKSSEDTPTHVIHCRHGELISPLSTDISRKKLWLSSLLSLFIKSQWFPLWWRNHQLVLKNPACSFCVKGNPELLHWEKNQVDIIFQT